MIGAVLGLLCLPFVFYGIAWLHEQLEREVQYQHSQAETIPRKKRRQSSCRKQEENRRRIHGTEVNGNPVNQAIRKHSFYPEKRAIRMDVRAARRYPS